MREIKFRAWFKNEPWQVERIEIDKNGRVTNLVLYKNGHYEYTSIFIGSAFTLEQYTGLKDKDGRDVCEGDIIKLVTNDVIYAGYCQEPYKKGQLFIVKKLISGYTLSIPKIIDSTIPNQIGHVNNYDFWNHSEQLEIIGSIHENPELLINQKE